MLRSLSFLPALAASLVAMGLVSLGMPVTGSTAAAAAPAAKGTARISEDPLEVRLDTMSPAHVPRRGAVVIRGTVTNLDVATWNGINVHPFTSNAPMTTAAELSAAVLSDPADYVGARITEPGAFSRIDSLEPGESQRFIVRVPREQLEVSTDPGVYWIGIHALGQDTGPRDSIADGRARTFIPQLPRTARRMKTALVVPLRSPLHFANDGSIDDVERWSASLATGGRLSNLLDFGVAAGNTPLTWLVDPAVPSAVRSLTKGNPARSLAPTLPEGVEKGDGPAPDDDTTSREPDGDPDDGDPAGASSESSAAEIDAAEDGASWLTGIRDVLDANQLLALPYGDLDVAAAANADPGMYRRARVQSTAALAELDLSGRPAVAPPSGLLSVTGIGTVEDNATLLLSDTAFAEQPPTLARAAGKEITVAASGAAGGGPGPEDALSSIGVRQRILSEAALRLLDDDPAGESARDSMVVALPDAWSPESAAGFFDGLDVPWLQLTSLRGATRGAPADVPLGSITYPPRAARAELGSESFRSARGLIRAGSTLESVLPRNDTISRQVGAEALSATSYQARGEAGLARSRADRSRRWIDEQLRQVTIEAPPSVTLSSETGSFAATLINNLDEPVLVRVEAVTDSTLTLRAPARVELKPGGSSTVLLTASSKKIGVHNVNLVVTNEDGVLLGSSDTLPIRSAQVSRIIWVILAVGVALLFGAIGVRLVRRIRSASA